MANIYIRRDEVYRTRIEDITAPDHFFYPVYQQARSCLEGMVRFTDRYWEEQSAYDPGLPAKGPAEPPRHNPIRLRGYPNNIIAFNADRGYGKTSAMLSFSTALKTMSRVPADQLPLHCKSADFWSEPLQSLRFFPLEPIDPTILEFRDCIIPVIISRMFAHFTAHAQALRCNTVKELWEQQQKLLQQFRRCYSLADDRRDTRHRSEGSDDLQLLADRSDSSNFKVQFAELVHSYLRFLSLHPSGAPAGDPRKAFLIIQIDDADMNPDHAYDVVEEIRKYCVLPNVVILFATNMEQLEMCVEQHFLKSFGTLLRSTVNGDTGSSHTVTQARRQCHSTAVNYLDKLIPSLHRINLPNINDVLQNYEDHVGLHYSADDSGLQMEQPREYREVFSELLRRKCVLDIRFQENIHHPFLPKHMRELTHFLNRLVPLHDVLGPEETHTDAHRELMKWAVNFPGCRDCSAGAIIWKNNLETMMGYLVNDWSELSLKSWQVNTIRDIHRAGSDQKIAAALESMDQNYFRYKSASGPVHAEAKNWSSLTEKIKYFQTKQDHLFSSALELYFEMHKELLTVCDCIRKREEHERHEH